MPNKDPLICSQTDRGRGRRTRSQVFALRAASARDACPRCTNPSVLQTACSRHRHMASAAELDGFVSKHEAADGNGVGLMLSQWHPSAGPPSPSKPPSGGPKLSATSKFRNRHMSTVAEREDSVMRIEHVMQHLEDLASMEEDFESSEDAMHQEAERRQLYRALRTISTELTEESIFADHLIETNHDDLAELTLHMLTLMKQAGQGVLSEEQFEEAKGTLHHHHHSGDLGAAMANGLAIVTLFADSVQKRKYAFARLKENVHLGEFDNKGIQFIFVMIEPMCIVPGVSQVSPRKPRRDADDAEDELVDKRDVARAMSLIVNQESLRDQLLTCAAESEQKDCIQRCFKTDGDRRRQHARSVFLPATGPLWWCRRADAYAGSLCPALFTTEKAINSC